MGNITRTALSALLALAVAAGAPTAVALADTAEGAMGEEPVAQALPQGRVQDPTRTGGEPATDVDSGAGAVAPEGEEPALTPQATYSGTWGTCKWEIDANGALTVHPGDAGPYDEGPLSLYHDNVTSIRFACEGGRKVRPTDGIGFSYMQNVTNVDLTGLDTSQITSMHGLFSECYSLTSLNLSGIDTSRVTDMSLMFSECYSLTSLNLSGLDTSRVTYMRSMFDGCTSLTSLNLSGLDTSRVTNMRCMFSGCTSLTSLDVSGFDTRWVSDMSYMFSGCSSLKSLDLSKIDTSQVRSMHSMYSGCSSLKSLDLSRFDTRKVTDTGAMFWGCTSLASLDLSGWNTSRVRNASGSDMFEYTNTLTRLKVGSGYAMRDKGMFPEASYRGYAWKSSTTGQLFTRDEIVAGRSGIADTYVLVSGDGSTQFPDVKADAWYAGVALRAAGLGLVNGYGNGNFGPSDNVTRGQVAVILWNMAGNPAAKGTPKNFPDVKFSKYYCAAVRWASSVGVVNGYRDGTFGPDDLVTREQLAAMLANYAGKVAGKDTSGSAADYRSMKDAAKVSSWAAKSVGWCFRNKIISGTKDGRVNPQGNATRAETAKMVVFLHDML